jgi:hypothetical protein
LEEILFASKGVIEISHREAKTLPEESENESSMNYYSGQQTVYTMLRN